MLNNYFTLNRLTTELNNLFAGLKLTEAFSFVKDVLILQFRDEQLTEMNIECSLSPGSQYISARREVSKKKKNVVNFFESLLPAELIDVQIAEYDRIVKFSFKQFSLFFTVRGKSSNILTLDKNNNVETFKSEEDDSIQKNIREFLDVPYTSDFLIPSLSNLNENASPEEIKKGRPYFSREIIRELKERTSEQAGKSTISLIHDILIDIRSNRYALFIEDAERRAEIAPSGFHYPQAAVKEKFDAVYEAVNGYIRVAGQFKRFNDYYNRIEKHLDKELSYYASKMNNLRGRIEQGSREEEYANKGNLILSNLYRIKKGMSSVTLEDFYQDGKTVDIPLKEDKQPNQNADWYFKKARGEKINFAKSKDLLAGAEKRYREFQTYRERLNEAETEEKLKNLLSELKIPEKKMNQGREEKQFNFKEYLIDGKFSVWVGRDSANNDVLTLKFAKQNDYWFHARAVPGSHVVLRGENPKEPVPKNILKKVASLAAYHSKAKTAGTVPVSYTFKKYVVKKKGMAPGKVALMKEDVLLVRPGIPDGCEFITDEE